MKYKSVHNDKNKLSVLSCLFKSLIGFSTLTKVALFIVSLWIISKLGEDDSNIDYDVCFDVRSEEDIIRDIDL